MCLRRSPLSFILDLLGGGSGCPGWSERGWETSPSEGWKADWPASRSLKGERESGGGGVKIADGMDANVFLEQS